MGKKEKGILMVCCCKYLAVPCITCSCVADVAAEMLSDVVMLQELLECPALPTLVLPRK